MIDSISDLLFWIVFCTILFFLRGKRIFWTVGALGLLLRPARYCQGVVAAIAGDPSFGSNRHLLSLPPVVSITAARPASSRATGTRNGEHDT